jgi:hypothetical protein
MHSPTLTTEEKHQLLSVLRAFDRNAPAEQRRQIRRKVQVRVTIRTLEASPTFIKSTIVNVSARGAGLLLSQPLPKKAKFLFPLRFAEGGGWLVLCEVRSCVAQPQRQWRIGARFLEHVEDPRDTEEPPLDWLL